MNTSTKSLKRAPGRGAPVAFLLSVLAVASAQAAVNSGSTGADGAFNPTVNTEVVLPESGILNYTTVNIPAGVTVKFKRNSANTPVFLLATGNVTIAGVIDIAGGTAAHSGTYGNGVLGDDGQPGLGGPGGYDGGRGGREDAASRPAVIRSGAGLGPGGGKGAIEGGDGCGTDGFGYYRYVGGGGAYGLSVFRPYSQWQSCGTSDAFYSAKAYGSPLLQPLLGVGRWRGPRWNFLCRFGWWWWWWRNSDRLVRDCEHHWHDQRDRGMEAASPDQASAARALADPAAPCASLPPPLPATARSRPTEAADTTTATRGRIVVRQVNTKTLVAASAASAWKAKP